MRSCLICDDHALMRQALEMTVTARWPGALIACASSFPEAWSAAGELAPDLVLVDLVMPGASERDGISRLQQAAPAARVVVVTGSNDDALLLDLLDLGIDGFLPKTCGSDIIVAAIELVLAGGRYLPPRVAELAAGRPSDRAPQATGPSVSPRQREILSLVAKGLSNKEIARSLSLSPATVKTHVANAIAIVGGLNRTDAAIKLMTGAVHPDRS